MNSIDIKFYIHPIYKDYAATENGEVYSLKNGKIRLIKQRENTDKYLRFNIYFNKKMIVYPSHRFVFECLNNRLIEENKTIDHINKDKKDNRISNLREVSRITNNLNRYNNKYIDKLPGDAIQVTNFDDNLFINIYFSPSTNCIYKSSDDYLFEIPFKSGNRVAINNTENKTVRIYLNKLRISLGFEK